MPTDPAGPALPRTTDLSAYGVRFNLYLNLLVLFGDKQRNIECGLAFHVGYYLEATFESRSLDGSSLAAS